jgi:hypothetical protein
LLTLKLIACGGDDDSSDQENDSSPEFPVVFLSDLTRCATDNLVDYLTSYQVSSVSASDICLETLAGEVLN